MAKDSPKPETKAETPFQRFERLARKLATVPKAEVEKLKAKRSSRADHPSR
jgi:hypothetical protein